MKQAIRVRFDECVETARSEISERIIENLAPQSDVKELANILAAAGAIRGFESKGRSAAIEIDFEIAENVLRALCYAAYDALQMGHLSGTGSYDANLSTWRLRMVKERLPAIRNKMSAEFVAETDAAAVDYGLMNPDDAL